MFIDSIFVLLVVMAFIKGYQKGLIVAVFSIVAYMVGLAAALKLSVLAADYLKDSISLSAKWLPFVSFIIVFFSVVLLVRLGGKLIEKAFRIVLLGWINTIGGILLYSLLYIFIFSIFLFYVEKLQLLPASSVASSRTHDFIQPWGPKVIDGFGKIIPIFRDMFTELESFFAGLSNKVAH